MRGKIYDIDEMNRALPLIRSIVSDIVTGYRELRGELTDLGDEFLDRRVDPRSALADMPWEVRDRVDDLRRLMDELEELGVFLMDPEIGLVSAYGEWVAEIVYFSWKPGEKEILFYHGLFGSHRDRRPVFASV